MRNGSSAILSVLLAALTTPAIHAGPRTVTIVAAVDADFRAAFGDRTHETLREVVGRVSELYERNVQLRFTLDPQLRDWSYVPGSQGPRQALRAAVPSVSASTLVVGFTAGSAIVEAGQAATSDPYVVIRRSPSPTATDELVHLVAHEVAHVFYAFHVGTKTGAGCHLMRVALEIIGEQPCPAAPTFDPATLRILRATREIDLSGDVRQLDRRTVKRILKAYEAHGAESSDNPIESAFVELGQRLLRSGDVDAARDVAEVIVEIEPENPAGLQILGHAALYEDRDPVAALEWYRRALAAVPEACDFHHHFAMSRFWAELDGELGEYRGSESARREILAGLDRAMELCPWNTEIVLSKGQVLGATDPARAVELLRELLDRQLPELVRTRTLDLLEVLRRRP